MLQHPDSSAKTTSDSTQREAGVSAPIPSAISHGVHPASMVPGAMPLATITSIKTTTVDQLISASAVADFERVGGVKAAELIASCVSISDGSAWILFHQPIPMLTLAELSGGATSVSQMVGLRVASNGSLRWIKFADIKDPYEDGKQSSGAHQGEPFIKICVAYKYNNFPRPDEGNWEGYDVLPYKEPNGILHRWLPIIPTVIGLPDLNYSVTHTGHKREALKGRARGMEMGSYMVDQATITMTAVDRLRVGDAVSFQYPFQKVTRDSQVVISAGGLAFPGSFPASAEEWQSGLGLEIKFLKGQIRPADYPYFLKAIIGCYPSELGLVDSTNPNFDIIKERINQLKKCAKTSSSTSQSALSPIFCFKPLEENRAGVQVGVGSAANIIFTIHRGAGQQPLYVVDSPNVCALYIFANETDSIDWATRRIGFGEARAKAQQWIPHKKGWESNINTYLREQGAIGY